MGLRFIAESVVGDIANAIRWRAHEDSDKKYTISGMISKIGRMGKDMGAAEEFQGGVFIPYSSLDMNNAYNGNQTVMFPVCGDNVTNMAYTYNNCYNLTGSPVCGDNVTNMAYTYYNCRYLTGSPVCGDKVTSMHNAYFNCQNLTGSPVCGDKVTDMTHAYYLCNNLTGSPVCGDNVTGMGNAYYGCSNLTGSPVCGDNVTGMYSTYRDCTNLTGSPVCGDKVTSMHNAYYNCNNLTGNPVCGDNVTDMTHAYYRCNNLTGFGYIGPNVNVAYNAFYNCFKIEGLLIDRRGIGTYANLANVYNWNSYTSNLKHIIMWHRGTAYPNLNWSSALLSEPNAYFDDQELYSEEDIWFNNLPPQNGNNLVSHIDLKMENHYNALTYGGRVVVNRFRVEIAKIHLINGEIIEWIR